MHSGSICNFQLSMCSSVQRYSFLNVAEKEGADKNRLLKKIALIELPWKQNLSGLYWH